MSLSDYGWDDHFERQRLPLDVTNLQPARIVRQDRNSYRIATASGERLAHLAGRMLREIEQTGDRPVIGDWVAVQDSPGDGPLPIHVLLPRRSRFSRKEAGDETREQVVAANIDTLFVVCGLDADFNLRRIERYVAQAWNSGTTPVLVLNKADVCPDLEGRLVATAAVAPGVDVHAVSAAEGIGLEALQPYLRPGRTLALVGSSGVGKSTLVNRWLGREEMPTASVREDDSRGRHTTTHRQLFRLSSGALLIDTPGMRELQVWGDERGVQAAFADVETLAEGCRYRDCTHRTEPGCAVRAAVESGALDAGRLRSFQKLSKELDYLALRQETSATYREHQRGRPLGKLIKQVLRDSPKHRR